LQINVTYDPSVATAPAQFKTAVQAAVQYFENQISSPVTVNISFGWGEVDGQAIDQGAIGESISESTTVGFSALESRLHALAATPAMVGAVALLPASDPTVGNGFSIATSEVKALGLFSGDPAAADGFVGLGAHIAFTFDPNNRGVVSSYDAIGVIEHEISEVLGRTALQGQIVSGVGSSYSVLDLFRYPAPGSPSPSAPNAGFSLNGDNILLPFNQASNGGDTGDWASSVTGDAFEAFAEIGVPLNVSAIDLRVLEALGYNLSVSATSPSGTPTNQLGLNQSFDLALGQADSFNGSLAVVLNGSGSGALPLFTNDGTVSDSGANTQSDVVGLSTSGGGTFAGTTFVNSSTGIFSVNARSAAADAVGVFLGPQVSNAGQISVTSATADAWGLYGSGLANASTGSLKVTGADYAAGVKFLSASPGPVSNDGQITVTADHAIGVDGAAAFSNTGSINVTALLSTSPTAGGYAFSASSATGVILDGPTSPIINAGTITVSSAAMATGVNIFDVNSGLSVHNTTTGAISVSGIGYTAVGLILQAASSTVVNDGTISVSDPASADAVQWDGGAGNLGFLNSSLTNSGTIAATSPGSSTNSNAVLVGSLGLASSASTITNTGEISGANAITNAGVEPLIITNSGSIQGYINFGNSLGSVLNSGSIRGTIQSSGGTETGSDADLGVTSTTVSNSGGIIGDITGFLNVVNAGTITGNVNAGAISNTAMIIGTVVSGTDFNNSGAVDGAIQIYQGSFENSGNVTGQVTLGASSQLLNTGNISGNVEVSNGTSAIDSRGGTVGGSIVILVPPYDPFAGSGSPTPTIRATIFAPNQGGTVTIDPAQADPNISATITGGSDGATNVAFVELRSQATLTLNPDDSWNVGGGDGTETLINVGTLKFADQLINLPLYQAQITSLVTGLYDSYIGRDPVISEVDYWVSQIANGANDNNLRMALVTSSVGVAYATGQITGLYDTYFGRDPGAPELSAWEASIQAGASFGDVRTALVTNPVGVAYATGQITGLYDTYFGRDPGAPELSAWEASIQAGPAIGFDQVRDTLERSPASAAAGVEHLTGSAQSDTINFPTNWTNAVIQNFDPSTNLFHLSLGEFGGINPLDATHAHQIIALDGSIDTLVQLDHNHSILFENTHLASLNSGDFVFG
jgi:hypothetical protein